MFGSMWPEPASPSWFREASLQLAWFVAQRGEIFVLSTEITDRTQLSMLAQASTLGDLTIKIMDMGSSAALRAVSERMSSPQEMQELAIAAIHSHARQRAPFRGETEFLEEHGSEFEACVALAWVAQDRVIASKLKGRSLSLLLQNNPRLHVFQDDSSTWRAALRHPEKSSVTPEQVIEEEDKRESVPALSAVPEVVLYENDSMAVLDKPAGTTTEAMVAMAQKHRAAKLEGVYRIRSVSRLDQFTSGVLVVPLTASSEAFLTEQFKSRSVSKEYWCLCRGIVPKSGEINARLRHAQGELHKTFVHPRGKDAVTKYTRLRTFRQTRTVSETDPVEEAATGEIFYSLVAAQPMTGRTHQIRAHMHHLGHPIVGDAKYNTLSIVRPQLRWCSRLFLHAKSLGLCVDATDSQKRMIIDSPLPAELVAVLDSLQEVAIEDDAGVIIAGQATEERV
eukprot:c5538_g1_i1.p1 GENE.c5538_g1_i1~~c5538_g1_i1.p1  ORF type:complete len:451 (+),score=95.92 c5538_g1_i1:421-1773(+)